MAIFTVRTSYQSPKLENLTLNLSEFWYTPKTASCPIGLLMVNIYLIPFSCIDIYAHSCLRPFSIGRKPCSNSKTHVQIMKFTCRLNMGFGRRHWSMRRDVMCFVETKWPTLKKLRCFRWVFTFANVIFKRFSVD